MRYLMFSHLLNYVDFVILVTDLASLVIYTFGNDKGKGTCAYVSTWCNVTNSVTTLCMQDILNYLGNIFELYPVHYNQNV